MDGGDACLLPVCPSTEYLSKKRYIEMIQYTIGTGVAASPICGCEGRRGILFSSNGVVDITEGLDHGVGHLADSPTKK
jgi:hypothetical protein